jgi:hypothetical protein
VNVIYGWNRRDWEKEGKSLREMRRLAVDRGRWKEFVVVPLTL